MLAELFVRDSPAPIVGLVLASLAPALAYGAIAGWLYGDGAEGQAEYRDRVGQGAIMLRKIAGNGPVRRLKQRQGSANIDERAGRGRLRRKLTGAAWIAHDRPNMGDHVVGAAGEDGRRTGIVLNVDGW